MGRSNIRIAELAPRSSYEWNSSRDINESGQIVGYTIQDNAQRPVRWDGTIPTILAPPSGSWGDGSSNQWTWGRAESINASGQVVGMAMKSGFGRYAARWDYGTPILFDQPFSNAAGAYGINNIAEAVGEASDIPAYWDAAGALTLLERPPDTPRASITYDINNNGIAVGQSGDSIPVFWDGTNYTILPLPDGMHYGVARRINNVGQVCGWVWGTGESVPVVWNPVPENLYPIADAGDDQIVFSEVTLDASKSSDPDGAIVTYEWSLQHRANPANDRTASDQVTTVSDLQPGFYDVTLTVTDNHWATGTDTMLLAVAGESTEWPSPNGDLSLNIFNITQVKKTKAATTLLAGKVKLPDLNLGDKVHGRVTIELFDALAGGDDCVLSEELSLKVQNGKILLVIGK